MRDLALDLDSGREPVDVGSPQEVGRGCTCVTCHVRTFTVQHFLVRQLCLSTRFSRTAKTGVLKSQVFWVSHDIWLRREEQAATSQNLQAPGPGLDHIELWHVLNLAEVLFCKV